MSEAVTATVHRYYLPQLPKWEDGWSLVYVDQWGVLAIASDWGNFTYVWGRSGRVHDDFREELLRFGSHYVQNKLSDHQNTRLNPEKTVKLVREHVLTARLGQCFSRRGAISKEDARADWDEVGNVSNLFEWRDFVESSTERYNRYWELGHEEPGNIGGLSNWIEKSWPRLRAMMQQELAAERRACG